MPDFLYVEVIGDRNILQNLDQLPDTVKEILLEKTQSWVQRLANSVRDNISQRLGSKTGRLLAAVRTEIVESGGRIDGRVVIDTPYAQAQDQGAIIPPHIIRPRNAKLLAFVAATGDKVMTMQVNHPGGVIPATNFAKDAYREMGPQISRGIKNAVVEGIRRKMRSGS